MLFERVDSEGEATDQEKKGGSSSNDQRKTNNKKVVSKATNSYQRWTYESNVVIKLFLDLIYNKQ